MEGIMEQKILFTLLICILFTTIGWGQWESDVRLTYDDGSSVTGSSNTWSIAASHDSVYIVWTDTRDGNSEIYFKRSLDAGVNWDADMRLTDDPAISGLPSILLHDTIIHVCWYDTRAGMNNFEIYYKRSTDAGVTWSADTRLTYDPAISWYQSIAFTNQNLHVVWRETRDGNYDIFYKRSSDQGMTWGPDTNLTQASGSSETPCITVIGSILHVLWFDNRDGGAYEIYYKRSSDQGVTWEPDVRITNDPGVSFGPCAVTKDSIIHVIWQDSRDGNWELYYKRSVDYGSTWGPDTRLTYASETSESPSVVASASNIHVVWWDNRDGNYEIYYKVTTDQGLIWSSDTRLTNDGSWSQFPHIAAADSMLHVIWREGRAGNDEIFYKRNPAGNPGIVEYDRVLVHQGFTVITPLFSNSIGIRFTSAQTNPFTIALHDISGAKVCCLTQLCSATTLYLSNSTIRALPAGVYFMTIHSDGQLVGRGKLIKVK
jgi:hypothetical protein